jgi:hypothetical protein
MTKFPVDDGIKAQRNCGGQAQRVSAAGFARTRKKSPHRGCSNSSTDYRSGELVVKKVAEVGAIWSFHDEK